jgi:hypothetical protein
LLFYCFFIAFLLLFYCFFIAFLLLFYCFFIAFKKEAIKKSII